jgi:hypothetical protein
MGIRVSPEGTQTGWFNGYCTEVVANFSVELVAKKIAATATLRSFMELKHKHVNVLEIITAAKSASEQWLEIAPPNGKGPGVFSCLGNYVVVMRELQHLYVSVGDWPLALQCAAKVLTALQLRDPPSQPREMSICVADVIES